MDNWFYSGEPRPDRLGVLPHQQHRDQRQRVDDSQRLKLDEDGVEFLQATMVAQNEQRNEVADDSKQGDRY